MDAVRDGPEEQEVMNLDQPQLPTPPPTQSREGRSPSTGGEEGFPDQTCGSPRRRHGFASIELHQGAAQVIRWENIDEDGGDGGGGNEGEGDSEQIHPEDVLRQKEWFELAEWLSTLPISNSERARYFDLERVSLVHSILLIN